MSNYVQLPPDGVGKKVRHSVRDDLYVTESGPTRPLINSVVYGSVSGATGTLGGVTRSEDQVEYYLKDVTGTFQSGDVISSGVGGSGTQFATVTTVISRVYSSSINIVDPNTPDHQLKIDIRGAALTSFPEGTPQFDGFGRMQVSQMQAVGEYSHVGEDYPGKYYTIKNGTATVTHDVAKSQMVYSIGTALGDEAARITNQYHPYKPGTSQLIYMTVNCGDTGKANVVREWGYMDKTNGFGFRLNGTQLQVFQRSDVTGTTQEIVVNQANWSDNNLINAVLSDFQLDVSKGNIYWMDMEWLGMGRVRLGVVTPDGRRITCHTFDNANKYPYPYMKAGSLPLMWRIYNTGVSASTSEFRVSCAAVFSETADLLYQGELMHICPAFPVQVPSATEYTPFLCFKAKSKVNGYQNRMVGIHETFDWSCHGDSNISIGIFVLPNEKWMTGVEWSDTIQPQTMLWVDTDTTYMPNLQYWSTKAKNISGSITGDTMTVTALTGTLYKEMYFSPMPVYENGPISGGFQATAGSVASYTKIKKQLTATAANQAATLSLGTQPMDVGVAGSKRLVVNVTTGAVVAGQLISGTNIPLGTTVIGIEGNTLVLSDYFTGSASGTYTTYTKGGPGTYKLMQSQANVASFSSWGAYFGFFPIESFIAPMNSTGRTALGDRMEKSFGLGGNPDVAEDEKPVFVFAARLTKSTGTSGELFYTKYWKEIR